MAHRRVIPIQVNAALLAQNRKRGVDPNRNAADDRATRWWRENATAIADYNARVECHGLFGDRRRRF